MNFTMPCETFARMATIANAVIAGETRTFLKSVAVECKSGKAFVIASNGRIMAIEYLGPTQEPDGFALITVDAALVQQCETERSFNSTLLVTVNAMLGYASAKTTFGYNFPANALAHAGETVMNKWRDILPKDMPRKTDGAMYWRAETVAVLASASPSGMVVFPEFINVNEPVIIRDLIEPNWCGVFLAQRKDDETGQDVVETPAKFPDWL